ncbi:hypothetical protein V1478_015156, partial [Vespula squamosa]
WNCALAVFGCARRKQSRSFERLCRLLAQFYIDFRRVYIVAPMGCIEIVHSRSSDARDENKVGPSNDFVDFWLSFALTFDECTSQLTRDAFPASDNEGETQDECSIIYFFDFLCNIEIVHSRSSDGRDENKVGLSNDFVDFWLNFALTFDECTSQLPRDASPGSDNEGETQEECSNLFCFSSELCTGCVLLHVTIPESNLRSTLT